MLKHYIYIYTFTTGTVNAMYRCEALFLNALFAFNMFTVPHTPRSRHDVGGENWTEMLRKVKAKRAEKKIIFAE